MQIRWTTDGLDSLAELDRVNATRVIKALDRYAETGAGDVKALRGPLAGQMRLRVGDYRVLFEFSGDAIVIQGVRHRSQAYS